MISPNLLAIWVFLFLNLSQDLKLVLLKGPKHDQVGYEFFYIKQTRMVR